MTRWHTCPGCGERTGTWLDSIVHCDMNEPIDDIEGDND